MTSTSSDHLFESLSALVDNEANELEVRRLLKNVENNPELLERWRRYHLIGSALRKERSVQISGPNRMAESIASYIDAAPTEAQGIAVGDRLSAGWRELVGKSAVAASFAATLVLGFNFLGGINGDLTIESSQLASAPSTTGNIPASSATLHTPVGFELPLPEARTVSTASGAAMPSALPFSQQGLSQVDDITDPATQQFLNQLLIQHAERASTHGSLGIMPFARVSRMNSESLR